MVKNKKFPLISERRMKSEKGQLHGCTAMSSLNSLTSFKFNFSFKKTCKLRSKFCTSNGERVQDRKIDKNPIVYMGESLFCRSQYFNKQMVPRDFCIAFSPFLQPRFFETFSFFRISKRYSNERILHGQRIHKVSILRAS